MSHEDWFYKLKQEIVFLTLYDLKIQHVLSHLVNRYPFLLTDSILDEHYCLLDFSCRKIQKMMTSLVDLIHRLEKNQESFFRDDLEMMLLCLKEILSLERKMIQNFYQLLMFRKANRLTEVGYECFKKSEMKCQQNIWNYVETFNQLDVFNERKPDGRI